MSEEHYGEPTDSLRSMMKILWKMEDNLYELMGYRDIVNKEQLTYMKKTAKEVDRLTDSLQHIIDLGDD
jgi:Mg2+ and Co2+ transporter CorA